MAKNKSGVGKVEEVFGLDSDDEENIQEKADNNFELKKWGANVWSDMPEINKDFTLSNLSDNMFDSRIVNFIRNRVFLVKMVKKVYKYAEMKITDDMDSAMKEKIIYQTEHFTKTKNIILAEPYTILNLSKARGGLVLKAFLEGGMSKEEMELVAGDGTAVGEIPKRSWMDRLLGKNKRRPEVAGKYVS